MVYQCQRCFGKPEGFLVRRELWILGLHGRSPIELVEVPAYIPKAESWLHRDAVIAFNSGKILAGLFYLRTFIEQFARRVTGLTGRVTGDEIMDAYYKGLPAPNKDQMPSLREWYDKLSEALHSAKQDVALFETAKAQIEKHFDMRRVFEISEKSPAPGETKPAMAASKAPKSPPEWIGQNQNSVSSSPTRRLGQQLSKSTCSSVKPVKLSSLTLFVNPN